MTLGDLFQFFCLRMQAGKESQGQEAGKSRGSVWLFIPVCVLMIWEK